MKSSRKRKRSNKRQLRVQTLETRQLLAADFGELHNQAMPEDVNNDGIVSSVDALMIINRIGRGRQARGADEPVAFGDVNDDGNVTSMDALRIINHLGRQRRANVDRPVQDPNPSPATDETRSIDGTGNNLADPALGSANTELRRLVDSDYADGISEPSGADRPSAREVSNILVAQEESVPSERGLSDLVWQWGQFIDHDIILTVGGEDDEFNISVPTGDEFFDPFSTGQQEIGLTRSAAADGTGVDTAREQVNGITAFIDGSMVYGSSQEIADALRSFEGGRLATSENDLLPIDEASGFFMAGDVRANEQHGLTAMHTLWVREHNRIADQVAAENPTFSDEQIYLQARAIVIAEIQAITFNEYLPSLLGRDAISAYEGYDSEVDPSISNLFATAAFRYGHTSLSSELKRLDDDGNEIEEGSLALSEAFFNPTDVIQLGIDPLLKGMASNVSQEIDTQLVDEVRNFLFGPPGAGGFDLASLNIQRGRDHGLPGYNSAREQLGLAPAESFADISSDLDVQAKLEEAYGTVDLVDVWVGLLAEDHLPRASVGELAHHVLVEQFTALRDGDRFWYQNVLEGSALREIEQTRLSDVIERNTDLTSIQPNAFVVPDAVVRPDERPRSPRGETDSERGPGQRDRPPRPPVDAIREAGPSVRQVAPGPVDPPVENADESVQPDDAPPPPRPANPAVDSPERERPGSRRTAVAADEVIREDADAATNRDRMDALAVDQLLSEFGRINR